MDCTAWGRRIWQACLLLCCAGTIARAAPSVTLYYYERKPFHYTAADGQVIGLVVEPAAQAFQKAGIAVTWKLMPASRILATLKSDVGYDCSPGWYKTAEREQYARYSLPIYNDKPLVAIVRADFPVSPDTTAKDFFLLPHIKLVTKQGFVHGAYLDRIIAAMPPSNVITVPDDISSIVRMLHLGIGDVVTTTQEEAEYYITDAGYRMNEFHMVTFPDIPAVEKRYILCSKRVPAEIMEKLNASIKNEPASRAHTP